MKVPLISIALCTYNGEKYLREQLDTLVDQTYKNLEIIIVDDCSTDSTMQILEEYAEQYINIKVYQNKKNLGYIKNFEKALSLCLGEYIAMSDQDDSWALNKIEYLVGLIKDNQLIYEDIQSKRKQVSSIKFCKVSLKAASKRISREIVYHG